ncbi:MAG: hypoxanthine-guanine phosphoribosyltransferase [Gammaproteobacteria bacterium]|nr:MAG: hypoxanthine-guanine phosphoribosyltransferase [Gammaproteobacteria bacterium]
MSVAASLPPNSRVLYSAGEVDAACDRMAAAIEARLGKDNPVVLCVMIGALIPTAALLRRLTMPLELDYVHATRYRGATRGGALHWEHRPAIPLRGRSVLVVDDVLDEGVTLEAIVEECRRQEAREVLTAVLVDKEVPRRKGLARADFTGLKAPNLYLFGCGMDYHGQLRHCTAIHAIEDT